MRPVSISYSTTPNAQMSARLSTAFPRACSGLMYAAVPRICPARVDSTVIVGESAGNPPLPAPVPIAFASPKSSTFTCPSGVILIFAGLRSRCTIPFSCAASSASAIWRAYPIASSAESARGETLGERLPLDQFHHERDCAFGLLQAVDRRDVGMIERGKRLRLTLEPGHALRIPGEFRRQDLDGNFAIQPGIASPVHLPHASRAQRSEDVVWADAEHPVLPAFVRF